ncbi:MAG: amidohydrolase [Dehalococcoidales bacterium]|nr:amidohydrolase [Dehalococcoidales bacterium]
MPTDLILKNANVVTMDAARPRAELAAVSGDSIFFTGGNTELERLTGRSSKVIDCAGRTVVPGFNDAHLHLFSFVRKLLSIDLSPASVRSIEDIKEAVRKKAQATPPGTWISGTDYNEFYLQGGRIPTRWDLDEVTPDHPVVLSHRSLHECVLNSLALKLAGINAETQEPPNARIERDLATGEPNGILIDMLSYIRSEVMPPFSDEEMAEGVALADRYFLSHGITSFQEATVSNDLARWEKICSLKLNDDLRSRITMMAGAPFWKDFKQKGLKTGYGDNLMQLGAVKVMPAVRPEQSELNQLALDCHKAGFQLAFHAVDEATVDAAITAMEYVSEHSPVKTRRHRIEHCGECTPSLLERIKKLGLVIITQPPFIYYNGERYLATVPKTQQPWLYRIRSPLEAGIVVAGSSDSPVVTADPLAGIYAAVTRRAENGQVLLPEERITVEQALALYTVNAAYSSFEEKTRGSIAPGKLADMVILSGDPTRVPPEKIKDIKVEMTIIGGEVVWEG